MQDPDDNEKLRVHASLLEMLSVKCQRQHAAVGLKYLGMNGRNQRSEDEHQFVAADTFYNSERLLQALSQTSAIGFAILDDKLRYQAINKCLASINGLPAEAHLRFTTRDIFGELSEKIAEASYRRVLGHGETSQFEVKDVVFAWQTGLSFLGIKRQLPHPRTNGRVQQIAVMVVDVTEQRRLEMLFL